MSEVTREIDYARALSMVKKNHNVDEELTKDLSWYSVRNVNTLLDTIIADKSRGEEDRRRWVSRVIKNQPHATENFEKYDKWNTLVTSKNDTFISFVLAISVAIVCSIFIHVLVGDVDGGEVIAWTGTGALFLASPIGTLFLSVPSTSSHAEMYGERASMTTEEYAIHQQKERQKLVEQKRQELEELSAGLSGEIGTVSLPQVKQDYKEAKARVASYETDFDKALRFPAFNDVTIPSTREMIKQMRICRTMSTTVSVVNAAAFAREVDELWVRIQEAEKMAARIAWSHVGMEEQKDLDRAQKLFAQVNDPGNTEVMKENLYAQLKVVIDRLNKTEQIVPVKVVAQIEAKKAPVAKWMKAEEKETAEA